MRASEFVIEADISRRNFLKQAGNAAASTAVPGKAVAGMLGMAPNVTKAIAELRKLAGRDDTFSDMFRGLFGDQDFFKLPFNMQFSLEDFEDFEEAMANKGIDVDLYSDEYFDDIMAKHPEATLRQWHEWASKIIGRKTEGAKIFDILDKNGFTSDSLIEKYFLKSPQLTNFFKKFDMDLDATIDDRNKYKKADPGEKAQSDIDSEYHPDEIEDFKKRMLSKDHEWDRDDDDDEQTYGGSATGKFVEPWTAKATPKTIKPTKDREDFVKEAKTHDHWGLHNPQMSGIHIMPGVDQGYELYRLGLDMACAGDKKTTKWPPKEAHPAGGNMVVVAYSEGDHEIVGQTLKHRGISHKDASKGPSREDEHVHRVSPVAARKKNRYGV